MDVRIYKPAKTAMQSGKAKTHKWILEEKQPRHFSQDPLMNWVGSEGTPQRLLLKFSSQEEAIAYAVHQGWSYEVSQPADLKWRPKSYAENFSPGRQRIYAKLL